MAWGDFGLGGYGPGGFCHGGFWLGGILSWGILARGDFVRFFFLSSGILSGGILSCQSYNSGKWDKLPSVCLPITASFSFLFDGGARLRSMMDSTT